MYPRSFLDSIRSGYVPNWLNTKEIHCCTYKFQVSDGTTGTSSLPLDLCRDTHRLLSSKKKIPINYRTEYGSKSMKYTIPRDCRFQSCVRSPLGGTQSGETPTKFSTISTTEGIERSPHTTASLKACVYVIQSLCSVPFNPTSLNSVTENGSKVAKTTDAHICRHFFSNCKSKMGYSTKFPRYPLPANSIVCVASTCDPPTRETSNTERPTTLRSCPRTTASRLVSPLYLLYTATHILRNVSRSHVRTKTRMASDAFPNSTLN